MRKYTQNSDVVFGRSCCYHHTHPKYVVPSRNALRLAIVGQANEGLYLLAMENSTCTRAWTVSQTGSSIQELETELYRCRILLTDHGVLAHHSAHAAYDVYFYFRFLVNLISLVLQVACKTMCVQT